MSLHVFTPFQVEECASAVMRAVPMAHIRTKNHTVTVGLGRHRIRIVLEPWGPLETNDGCVRSKVNFYSAEPDERVKPLENSMAEEERLAEAVRSMVRCLQSIEVSLGSGNMIPAADFSAA